MCSQRFFCLTLAFCLFETGLGSSILVAQEESGLREELRDYPARILFEAYDGNNWELFMMNADGSDVRNLTNTPDQHEFYPQASPDGTMLTFICDEQAEGKTVRNVDVMQIDGRHRKRVASQARQPCWSPDGKEIAFVRMEFGKFNIKDYVSQGLLIYNVASGETREAGNKKVHHIYVPNWSPDGKWIVTTVHGGMGFGHAIIAIEIDGDRVVDLGIPGCRPCLSADGKLITWSSNDHTVNVGTLKWSEEGVKVVGQKVLHQESQLHTYHPDFSPDGRYVVFSLGPGGRVRANGPGTHTEVAEMIGVRGPWELVLKPVTGEGPLIKLTRGEQQTSKEAEWISVKTDR